MASPTCRPAGSSAFLGWSARGASQPPELAAIGIPELREIFAGEPQALAILGAARDARSATLNHVLAEVPRRYDERTVLIGDAAHPVGAGQGACMAIEDAVVLAHELRSAPNVADALAGYDRQRQARLGQLVRMAAANRDAKLAGPVTTGLRNVFMPLFFKRFYGRATGWLYTYELPSRADADRSSIS